MMHRRHFLHGLFGLLITSASLSSTYALTLEEAVKQAHKNDIWLEKSQLQENAQIALSSAAGALPDPRLSFGVANLPTDSFDFDQEAMTQFKVGVSQMFPRGSSRSLQRHQLMEGSRQHPHMRRNRQAEVRALVSKLWLEIHRHQGSIKLIEQDRALFDHLADVAESNYSSGLGNTQQHDLIRAQLELTKLEDRLTVLHQKREMNLASLKEWLPDDQLVINDDLPALRLNVASDEITAEQLTAALTAHPKVKALDQRISATHVGVKLAKQKYNPQWGLNASYGYRDDDPMGNERSDFFSFGVIIDVPIYASTKQDQEVQAAQTTASSIQLERSLLLRAMRAQFESQHSHLRYLEKRESLYQGQLLREMHNQAEAALSAYTHDASDFSNVVKARIAELNAKIDFLNIQVDRLITIAQLNYFLAPSAPTEGEGF